MDHGALSAQGIALTVRQRQLLHFAGGCLALAGMVYVGIRLHVYWSGLSSLSLSLLSWSGIVGLAMFYGGANAFLAIAWWLLLRHHKESRPLSLTIKVFGISQLAKYVPGNVAHFAGRQALGMSYNMAGGPVAKSLIWELALLTLAAAQFGWMAIATVTPHISHYAGISFFCASFITTSYICWRLFGRDITRSFVCEVLFFFASALVFASLAFIMLETKELPLSHFPSIGGAFILAWLAGFITPGAPAGIGVREGVLLFLLEGLAPETELLLLVLLSRLVSVLGDLLFFLIALISPTTPLTANE